MSHLAWVLGTKHRSSGRAANSPTAETSLQLHGTIYININTNPIREGAGLRSQSPPKPPPLLMPTQYLSGLNKCIWQREGPRHPVYKSNTVLFLIFLHGAREMVLWLKACAAPAEDPRFRSQHSHQAVHNYL